MSNQIQADFFELPVSLKVRGSIDEIFRAWTDSSISQEWLCDRVEGEWQEGKSLFWFFGETRQELRILEIQPNRMIRFRWNSFSINEETEVVIKFKNLGDEVGLSLNEGTWSLTVDNVKVALDSACGWENVFCRLKAWIEAKVKLR